MTRLGSAWDGASAHIRVGVGGASATVGGLMWVVKGGVILSGGAQPPILFEVASFSFGAGLIGMHAWLVGGSKRLAKYGVVLAYVALSLALGNVIIESLSAD